MKYLPDEVFNIEGEKISTTQIDRLSTEKAVIDFEEDYQLVLADYLQKLISKDELATNAIAQGFVIPKIPFIPTTLSNNGQILNTRCKLVRAIVT